MAATIKSHVLKMLKDAKQEMQEKHLRVVTIGMSCDNDEIIFWVGPGAAHSMFRVSELVWGSRLPLGSNWNTATRKWYREKILPVLRKLGWKVVFRAGGDLRTDSWDIHLPLFVSVLPK